MLICWQKDNQQAALPLHGARWRTWQRRDQAADWRAGSRLLRGFGPAGSGNGQVVEALFVPSHAGRPSYTLLASQSASCIGTASGYASDRDGRSTRDHASQIVFAAECRVASYFSTGSRACCSGTIDGSIATAPLDQDWTEIEVRVFRGVRGVSLHELRTTSGSASRAPPFSVSPLIKSCQAGQIEGGIFRRGHPK
jgi:hypothetical protein